MICPECSGWGFDLSGQDCKKCDGIGELPDILPEAPIPTPQPPSFDPYVETDADWWKSGSEEDEEEDDTSEQDDV